jgi:hypothetical protein
MTAPNLKTEEQIRKRLEHWQSMAKTVPPNTFMLAINELKWVLGEDVLQ